MDARSASQPRLDEAALRAWVEQETGSAVADLERVGAGASRVTWLVDLVDDGGAAGLVLRFDSGDGPLSGTALNLPRETAVYRALADTPVRIPRLVAAHPSGQALLIERARGTVGFALADAETQATIARDYLEALADLHAVDVAALSLPGFPRPAQPGDGARQDLALWRTILRDRVPDGDGSVDWACDWLDAHAPAEAERVSLCHGDAGPGNFLFEGSRVTALLDWEFAHLGDPLDDLAWIAVRAQLLGGFGSQRANVAAWRARTGLDAVGERIEFYRALVLVRMAIACLTALAHAGARSMNTTVYALLLPYLRFLVPQALERAGCTDPFLPELAREGAAALEQAPAVLRDHAQPLAKLELP